MERMKMEDDVPLEYGILSKSIEQAQEKVEGYNFDIRKHVVQYDDVINRQREVIYRQRRTILEKDDLKDSVMDLVNDEIEALVKIHTAGDLPENWDLHGLANEVRVIVPLPKDFDMSEWAKGTRDEIIEDLSAQAEQRYTANLGEFARFLQTQAMLAGATLEQMRESRDPLQRGVYTWAQKHLGEALTPDLERLPINDIPADYREAIDKAFFDGIRLFRDRQIMIQTVDQMWVKHLTDLDELREGIGLRAYAQRDPLVSYRTEASNTYSELLDSIREQVANRIFNVQFNVSGQQPSQRRQQPAQAQRAAPVAIGGKSAVDRAIERGALKASGGGMETKADNGKPKPAATQKLGRNDVCPFCTSGKKLKHCDCEGARKWRGEL
jgi:preprotein translocase subunit SecA